MTIIKPILIFITLTMLASCYTKKQDDGKTYNATYEVGAIPSTRNFYKLDPIEKGIDSIFSDFDNEVSGDPASGNTFLHNRSRIYLDSGSQNNLYAAEAKRVNGIPAYCNCDLHNDTLYITTAVGFFGGAGFNINLFKDSFTSNFFIYTDDIQPYKSHLSDTAFANNAIANSRFQYLLLDQQPTYKANQQLTGFFTYTSERYYELKAGKTLDSSYVTGKIYFTCETKQVREPKWSY